MKKIIFILFLSTVVVFSFAQERSKREQKKEIKLLKKENKLLKLENESLEAMFAGDFTVAHKKYKKLLKIYQKDEGKYYSDIIAVFSNISFNYQQQGLYYKQLETCKIRHEYLLDSIDNYLPEYTEACLEYARVYEILGDINKVITILEEALSVFETKNIYNCDYIGIVSPLSILYMATIDLEKAEHLFEKVKKIQLLDVDCYNNVGLYFTEFLFLYSKGNLEEAILCLDKIPNFLRVQDMEESAIAAQYYTQKGLYLIELGKYYQAEPILLRAKEIFELLEITKIPEYSNTLNAIGMSYIYLGITDKAESYLLKALENNYAITQSYDYLPNIIIYNNLGNMEFQNENISKSLEYYKTAISLSEKYSNKNLKSYFLIQNNIANTYYSLDSLAQAQNIYLDLLSNPLIESFPSLFALIKSNYANIQYEMENYKEAETLYNESIELLEKKEKTYPNYLYPIFNLITLYAELNKPEKIPILLDKFNAFIKEQVEANFAFLSEYEKIQFIDNVQYNFLDIQYSTFKEYNFMSKELQTNYFEMELFLKNIILFSNNNAVNFAKNSKDSLIQNYYQQYLDACINEENLINTTTATNVELTQANNEKETTQKQLFREVNNKPEFTKTFTQNTTIDEIKHALKPNEVAIEFIKLHDFNNGVNDYYALILFNNSEFPEMIKLFEEDELIEILPENINSIDINSLYDNKSGLYDLIWQPIDSLLSRTDKIYFSTSGLLHNISFAALSTPAGQYISDKYELKQLLNLKSICEPSLLSFNNNSDLVIYGGINYDTAPTIMQNMSSIFKKQQEHTLFETEAIMERSAEVEFLKYSKSEIDAINNIFLLNDCKTVVYEASQANEESFKSLDNSSPKIIHIATHGFFISHEQNNKKYDKNKLLTNMQNINNNSNTNVLASSGLMFSGVNNFLENNMRVPNTEDGVLMAYEIANLDLSATELVVLSACDTGLGEIKGNEGVFGLQRAFKIAGVDYIIASLWLIDDQKSYFFMKEFYKNSFKYTDIQTAFDKTQKYMKKEYPDKPYFWAGFILLH